MRVTNSVFAVALGSVVLACATPPPPEASSSSGLAVHLDVRSPLSIVPARVNQVLFVGLDESRDDPLLGTGVFYSNYSDDGYFYLLNPPPGRYVAVAAVSTSQGTRAPAPPRKSELTGEIVHEMPSSYDQQGFHYAVYFDEDFVQRTEVEARSGSVAFMGEFLVNTSIAGTMDPVQSHYFRLLQPGESRNWMAQAFLHDSGVYDGRATGAQRDEAAHERFALKASEHLTSAGWGEILKGTGEAPTP